MLIERAGEFASKEIWHSIVQLITNYPQLHVYAAEKVITHLNVETAVEQSIDGKPSAASFSSMSKQV